MPLSTAVLILIWTEFALIAVILAFRTYSTWKTKTYNWYLIFAWISTILGLGSNILCSISMKHGGGKHTKDLNLQQVTDATMYQWFLFYIYVWAITASRLSMIAALYRMVTMIRRKEMLLLFVGTVVVAVNMSTSVLQWVQCKPVSKTWDDRVDGVCDGRARNTVGAFVQGSTSAAVDLFLVMFPCVIIYGLNMTKNRKITLYVLFNCGHITVACAIVKTYAISLLGASDTTHEFAKLDIYAMTELWVSLMVGSIPSLIQYIRMVKNETGNKSSTQSNISGIYSRHPQEATSQEIILWNLPAREQ